MRPLIIRDATGNERPGVTLHFELPKALVLNANGREHWAQRARVTKSLRTMGHFAASQAGHLERAHLTIRVGWPDKRRRDVDNLAPTIKALVDGAVDAGVLPDDSDRYLIRTTREGYVAGKTGIVVLDLEFREVA